MAHSRDTLGVTGEAQRSSRIGEAGMKGVPHGNRRSDQLDCTASLTAAWGEVLTGCSSFSYKKRFQGSIRDRAQKFLSSTSNHASKSSFSHSINECKLCLASLSSGASGSTSTIPFS